LAEAGKYSRRGEDWKKRTSPTSPEGFVVAWTPDKRG